MKVWILTKSHIKRLMRRPALILMMLILPFCLTVILNFNTISEPDEEEGHHNMMLYIWNESHSQLADELIQKLETNKEYYIHVLKVEENSLNKPVEEAISEQIKEYSLGVHLYLPADFEKRVREKQQAVYLYEAGYDERIEMLRQDMALFFCKLPIKEKTSPEEPEIQTAFVNNEKEILDQVYQGYSFSWHMFIACIGIAFVMIDAALLNLWRKQNQKDIKNRMRLTGMDEETYALSKFIVLTLTLLAEVISCGLGIKIMVKVELGIPFASFMVMMLFYGMVLIWYAQLMGCICRESQSATYISVLMCNVFNLLAGMYFPIYVGNIWQSNLALLMPQYWVVYAVKALKQGKNQVMIIFIVMMSAFILFQWALLNKLRNLEKTSLVEEIT